MVLLLEDDEDDAFLVKAALAKSSRFAAEVHHVKTCAAAKEVLSDGAIDLVITDFWLGKENCLQFLELYSGRGGGLPSLLLTGVEDQVVAEAGMEAGAMAYLNKRDLSRGSLESAVTATLHSFRIENELRTVIAKQDRAVRALSRICRKEAIGSDEALKAIEELSRILSANEADRQAMLKDGIDDQLDDPINVAFQRADLIACIDAACDDALCLVDGDENDIVFHKPLLPVMIEADMPFLRESLADILASAVGAIGKGYSLMVQTRIEDGVCSIEMKAHSAALSKGVALGDGMEGLEFAQYILNLHKGVLEHNAATGHVLVKLPLRQRS